MIKESRKIREVGGRRGEKDSRPRVGKLQELSKDVFGYIWSDDDSVYSGYGSNQGFVILEDSVLVFDTGFTKLQSNSLCQAIAAVTDKKVRYIVNSHDHSDHVFGNSIISRRFSSGSNKVIIICHANCKLQIEKYAKKRLQKYCSSDPKLGSLLGSVDISSPAVTFPGLEMRLTLEGVDISLIHPETAAHTLGDTMIYLPKHKTLFAGDIVWNEFFPNLEDADLDGWVSTLNKLPLDSKDSTCLPGHGEPCGKEKVGKFSQYLREVQKRLLSIEPKHADMEEKRRCFEIDGTESWKMRYIVDWNIKSLLTDAKGNSISVPRW